MLSAENPSELQAGAEAADCNVGPQQGDGKVAERCLQRANGQDVANLQAKIGKAFKEFSIPFVVLSGGAAQRGKTISRFQSGDGPRVMLLNLQESAAGTSLTRASHVPLVHPMHAANPANLLLTLTLC